jgi:hypothetical protein
MSSLAPLAFSAALETFTTDYSNPVTFYDNSFIVSELTPMPYNFYSNSSVSELAFSIAGSTDLSTDLAKSSKAVVNFFTSLSLLFNTLLSSSN